MSINEFNMVPGSAVSGCSKISHLIISCLLLSYNLQTPVAAQTMAQITGQDRMQATRHVRRQTGTPVSCTYQTYKWNTKLKHAVDIKTVQKSYAQLGKHEVDDITGCSVCKEDQQTITLPGVKPFAVCKVFAKEIQQTLGDLIRRGEVINEVVGYRVGMTRGETDKDHNRTVFSNHSFGIALDINPQQNGLYDQCLQFNKNCRLIRGGPWRPGARGSLTRQSNIVRAMSDLGFRWGGLIAGRQKDFMHFSPGGY